MESRLTPKFEVLTLECINDFQLLTHIIESNFLELTLHGISPFKSLIGESYIKDYATLPFLKTKTDNF